jgi:hypothetical protein
MDDARLKVGITADRKCGRHSPVTSDRSCIMRRRSLEPCLASRVCCDDGDCSFGCS